MTAELFSDADVTTIFVRRADEHAALERLEIMVPVTVALKAGGVVHGLLCRPIVEHVDEDGAHRMQGTERVIVYYNKNADVMVAHRINLSTLGGWLRRFGGG